MGQEEGGYLKHTARKGGENDAEFYCLREDTDGELLEDPEDGEERDENGTEDYVLCPECGAIAPQADSRFQQPCEHDPAGYVKVRHVLKTKQGSAKCPICGFGSFRRFYLGAEAATAVLGTQLFEQLPSEEIIVTEAAPAQGRWNIFASAPQRRQIRKRPPGSFYASPTAAARPPSLPPIWNGPTRSSCAAGGCGMWRSSFGTRAGPLWEWRSLWTSWPGGMRISAALWSGTPESTRRPVH